MEPNYEWLHAYEGWCPVYVDPQDGRVYDTEDKFWYEDRWSDFEEGFETRPLFTPKKLEINLSDESLYTGEQVKAIIDALGDQGVSNIEVSWEGGGPFLEGDSISVYTPEYLEGEEPSWGPEVDMVNSPSHYGQGNIEAIEYIEDFLTREEYIGYLRGNIAKYTHRWRYKNGLEDLKKANWYLDRLMFLVEDADD